MQTFLPYEDFAKSAMVLDNRRLNKQLVEVQQIFNALTAYIFGEKSGWQNHPAVQMWRGHEYALLCYGMACYHEWKVRKGDSSATHKSGEFIKEYFLKLAPTNRNDYKMPTWLGNEKFHRSHQSNLVRKDAEFYGPQFPGVPNDLEYVWPTKDII